MSICSRNKGVSPVVGVILIILIVLILAALLGTIAFGFTDSLETTGTTNSAVEVSDGKAKILQMGDKENIIVEDENGNKIKEMDSVGESVEVSGGYKIISIKDDGSRQVLKRIDESVNNENAIGDEYFEQIENSSIIIIDESMNNDPEREIYNNIQDGVNAFPNGSHEKILIKEGSYSGFTIPKDYPNYKSMIMEGESGNDINLMDVNSIRTDLDIKNLNLKEINLDGDSNTGNSLEAEEISISDSLSISDYVNSINIQNSEINNINTQSSMKVRNSHIKGDISGDRVIDVRQNWWGDSSGPPSSVKQRTNYNRIIAYDRWCTNPECTSLSKTVLTDSDGNKYTTLQGALDAYSLTTDSDGGSTTINIPKKEFKGDYYLGGGSYTFIGSDRNESILSSSKSTTLYNEGTTSISLEDLTIKNSNTALDMNGHINVGTSITARDTTFEGDVEIESEYISKDIKNSYFKGEVSSDKKWGHQPEVYVDENWWGTTNETEINSRTDSVKWKPYCLDYNCNSLSS